MELTLQRLQLRLDQPRLELRRVERARLGLAAVGERVRQADQEQVRHQQPVELRQIAEERRRPPAREVGRRPARFS